MRTKKATARTEGVTTGRGSSLFSFYIRAQANILKDCKEIRQKISFYLEENHGTSANKNVHKHGNADLRISFLSLHHFCQLVTVKYEGDSLWELTEPLEVCSGI